jgi:hypothetical protein
MPHPRAARPLDVGVAFITAFIVGSSLVSITAQDATFYRDTKARDLFDRARVMIFGGPGGHSRLRSLTLKGASRLPGANGELIDGRVEIRILLPDRYLRIDSGSFGRRLTGYAGKTPLDAIETADRRILPDARNASAVVGAGRAELARLMLGLATWVSQELPLTLQSHSTPIALPNVADALVVDATSDDGFAVRMVFDGQSRVPTRLVYWGADRTVMTTTLLDRRSTGGARLPYRIVTTAADRVVDELSFDEVVVNPSLSKADFAK